MKRYVVLVAGGSGTRMKSDVPKQFLSYKGKPVLVHTIERFNNYDKEIKIILVLPDEARHFWDEIINKTPLSCDVIVTGGGKTRSDSTRAGLKLVPENCLVAIHDAVRPLVSNDLLDRCFNTAEKHGNSCPCITPADSMRIKVDERSESVDRSLYLQVQTPQCFHSTLLKEAFEKIPENTFTDETSLLEKAGHRIHLVEGERWNIKITYPEDLLVAEVLSLKGTSNKLF